MSAIAERSRTADPRLARESDRRGRRSPRFRRAGSRRRCPPGRRRAFTRRSSCAMAATPGAARASRKAVANVNGEIADAVRGRDAVDQAAARPRADRARRARRTRAGSARTRSSASRSPRRRPAAADRRSRSSLPRRRRRATLPVPMLNVINGGAHARQLDRPAGVHGRPRRRATRFAEGAAHRRRGLPRAQAVLQERGLATGVGDEGGFAPRPRVERGGDRGDPRGGRPRRASRRASRSRSIRRRARSSATASTRFEGRELHERRDAGVLGGARRALPDRLDRGRPR